MKLCFSINSFLEKIFFFFKRRKRDKGRGRKEDNEGGKEGGREKNKRKKYIEFLFNDVEYFLFWYWNVKY